MEDESTITPPILQQESDEGEEYMARVMERAKRISAEVRKKKGAKILRQEEAERRKAEKACREGVRPRIIDEEKIEARRMKWDEQTRKWQEQRIEEEKCSELVQRLLDNEKKEHERKVSAAIRSMRKRFSRADILRLRQIDPFSINCSTVIADALRDMREITAFMDEYHQTRDKLDWIYAEATLFALLQPRLEKRLVEVLKKEQQAEYAQAGQDSALAAALWHAMETADSTVGHVYFKRWTMPDGSAWYKVGITNDATRREAEQNVLPVAAETLACVNVGSMDRARVIETTIHQVLAEQRITDANNREIFHLTDQQASAVIGTIERLR